MLNNNKQAVLKVNQLSCERNGRSLFSDLSFAVKTGQALQIEGGNGAGKTSLLRILAGLHAPLSGSVTWCGESIIQYRDRYHSDIAYLGHQAGVKQGLTAYENLSASCALQTPQTSDTILKALAQVNLSLVQDQLVAHLSAGQQRRVAVARLLLQQATLWILDEPFTAIDSSGVELIERLISKHVLNGGMVILTSHQTVELPEIDLQRMPLT